MEKYELEFEKEAEHLEGIKRIAEKQLRAAQEKFAKNEAEILKSKQEMRDERRHTLFNYYSLHGFHELVELNQTIDPVSGGIGDYEAEAQKIQNLKRLMDSAYFARVDFKFEDENEEEAIYIGRTALMEQKFHQIYVYDWRTPIAGIFYRFGQGRAYYTAPAGEINGEILLKRQYEIKNGVLEYFFDADVQIVDEFLRKLLAKNTSSQMKTIVETIQRDQDIVIRDMENDILMVQGVAGSGKTSIALHRAAYLMYRGLAKKLSYHNILIVSPNTLFECYISGVLPELGERNVMSVTFEELFSGILKLSEERLQTRNQYLEELLTAKDSAYKQIRRSSMEFKTSKEFHDILERFIYDIPRSQIVFTDIYYDGICIAKKELLKAKLLNGRDIPITVRLKQLKDYIFELVHERKKLRLPRLKGFIANRMEVSSEQDAYARLLSIYEHTALFEQVKKFIEFHPKLMYEKLFSDKNYFYTLAKGIKLPENIEQILDFTKEELKKEKLRYGDMLALSYLTIRVCGYFEYKDIMQVVIDEAQDYYPLHFELLRLLFSRARYTVLGDINQTIEKSETLSFYEMISKLLHKEKSNLVVMDKSFRCTSDILDFGRRFLPVDVKMESFSRSGDVPAVLRAENLEGYLALLTDEIQLCRERGYASIGLICMSQAEANWLYEQLCNRIELTLIRSDTAREVKGTFLIPVYMSKGLEFDAVLLCEGSMGVYEEQERNKLFYVACTRALHRLNIFRMDFKEIGLKEESYGI